MLLHAINGAAICHTIDLKAFVAVLLPAKNGICTLGGHFLFADIKAEVKLSEKYLPM